MQNKLQLFSFSAVLSFLTYGFALTNYSLTVDSESPIFQDYALGLGRWGTNIIRVNLLQGHLPYFTLLLGLIFLSLSAVELSKIFRLKGIHSFIFCALFITLPQHAYQLVFTLQADAVPIGFFLSILATSLFIDNIDTLKKLPSLLKLIVSCFLIVFSIAIYQALVFIPVVTYLIYFFNNLYRVEFSLKSELKKFMWFIVLMTLSGILYYISVKILCPATEEGYLASYTAGQNDRFIDFYNLWVDNIRGDFYYGDKTYLLALIASIALFGIFIKEKKNLALKSLSLLLLMIIPFVISFFITSGANPPRLYVSSSIVFAFVIVHLIKAIKKDYIQQISFLIILVLATNIYFVTNLFYSTNRIFKHDLNIATKIDNAIRTKYPDFNSNSDFVYFYGALPNSNYEKLQLPNSDVFGGSLFRWDGGNNWRIINFFRYNDIAYYRFLHEKESFDKVKDSIPEMPTWPNPNSIQKINNVVIIKIGNERGAPLPFE